MSDYLYIGRIPCGCAVAVCIDDKHAAKDVMDMVKSGYAVERVTAEEYHKIKLGCSHRVLPAGTHGGTETEEM